MDPFTAPGEHSPAAGRHHERAVARYYDRNTRRFVRLGGTGRTRNIHRCLWAPGITDRQQAAHCANALVLERLLAGGRAAPRVLDLGCGVGAGLAYIGARLPAGALTGVTLSAVQAEAAAAALAPLSPRLEVAVHRASFLALPAQLGEQDLAYAIEAFAHAADPAAFFAEVARVLRPGGELVIVDDTLCERALTPRESRLLARFQAGWLAPSLRGVAALAELASTAGLELRERRDLSPWLALGRPRDRLIHLLVAALGPLRTATPYLGALSGGDALQQLLGSGAIRYRLLRFSRR